VLELLGLNLLKYTYDIISFAVAATINRSLEKKDNRVNKL